MLEQDGFRHLVSWSARKASIGEVRHQAHKGFGTIRPKKPGGQMLGNFWQVCRHVKLGDLAPPALLGSKSQLGKMAVVLVEALDLVGELAPDVLGPLEVWPVQDVVDVPQRLKDTKSVLAWAIILGA